MERSHEPTPAPHRTGPTHVARALFAAAVLLLLALTPQGALANSAGFNYYVQVVSPPSAAGTYLAGSAAFGADLAPSGTLSGEIVYASPPDSCSALTNAAQVAGKIALVDRSVFPAPACAFAIRSLNAQNAGAIGVIVVNNASPATPVNMAGGDANNTIPTLSIRQDHGTLIKTALMSGPVSATSFTVSAATKLVVAAPTPASPTQAVTFSATVTTQDTNGTVRTVNTDTLVTLSKSSGTGGTLGGTLSKTLTAGQSSVTFSDLTVSSAGTVVLTATRVSGDLLTAGDGAQFTVQGPPKTPTTTTLASSVNPSVFGQSVTITATVASGGAGRVVPFCDAADSGCDSDTGFLPLNGITVPTGTVTFTEGGTTHCAAVALAAGTAACALPNLSVGTHNITASYSGDSSFAIGASDPLSQVVNKAPTTTTLTATPNPSPNGQNVTFTATVAAVAPGVGTPTSTVTFNDSATPLCVAIPLAGGSATCTLSTLSVGSHSVSAVSSGSSDFNGSTSSPVTQTVTAAPTKLAVSAPTPGSPTAGQGFSLIVTALDAGNVPRPVVAATVVILSVKTGSGVLGGTLTGTLPAGQSSVTITGVTYSIPQVGVVLMASRTGGDNLAAGDSPAFTVNPRVVLRLEQHPAAAAQNGAAVAVQAYADAGVSQMDGVQFRLTYDPAKLRVADADGETANGVNLQPGAAFSRVLQNRAETSPGVINYAASRALDQSPSTGTVLVATLWVQGLAAGQQPLTFDPAGVEMASGGLPLGVTLTNGAVDVRAKNLRFVQQPIRGAHGVALGMQPVVAITDGAGAVVAGDSTTVVTLRVRAGTGAAGSALVCAQTVGGVTQAQAANGLATFSGCSLSLSGADYQLEATAAAPDLAPGWTGKFNVSFAGDTDGGCRVSVVDISLVVTHYGKVVTDPAWIDVAQRAFRADLDGDNRVGVLDFSVAVSRFGTEGVGCAPTGNPALVILTDAGTAPANITVQAGQTVLFMNNGAAPHTTTGNAGLWNSGLLAGGQSFARVFDLPGVFAYHSTQNGDGSLVGTVTVLAATPPQAPS